MIFVFMPDWCARTGVSFFVSNSSFNRMARVVKRLLDPEFLACSTRESVVSY